MWERFQALQGGVLVVGHGTRVASGVHQLMDLARQLQSHFGDIPTEPGFLELAQPTILEAMIRLRIRGVHRVMVIPVLLFEAAHAQSDIPEAVKIAAESESLSIVAQSSALGTADAALSLSEFRFEEALGCRNPAGCLMAGECPLPIRRFNQQFRPSGFVDFSCTSPDGSRRWTEKGVPRSAALVDKSSEAAFSPESFGSIGLAMIGRGTSNRTALESMRRFTELRVTNSKTSISWVQTGFFAGSEPTVDQLLENALRSNCDTLVIQPHLLFEGELVQQLREKVQNCQQISKDRRWLVTPTLGADSNLARAFYALASQSLQEFL